MLAQKFETKRHDRYGFYQITPTPTPEEITQYYADEFYSSAYPQLNNSSLEVQERDQEFHDAHREEMYLTLCELLGSDLKGKKILDFGCGWGQTLKYFMQKGAECFGCDPAIDAVEHAKRQGLNVISTHQMHDLSVFKQERFDVVMLLNVLEHLADPVAVIQQIRKSILKDDGLLLIEVPNDFNAFQECATRVHGLPQWWVAPPAHLNYFNKDTLNALLQGEGFVIERQLGTFPLEMFLLFGDNYVKDPQLGRKCHEKRMAFEKNLKAHGFQQQLQQFYQALAQVNLGRQILTYARSK